MGVYTPYAVAETEPTKWRPGEELAASGFVAINLLLFVDVNIAMWRLFKKRQGLYYWSMMSALIGILIDATGIIVKYFIPHPLHLWPLYTLCLVGGWSIYAPAQLLVLYSRLHLVNQNLGVQRSVLVMVVASVLLLILPTWILAWPAEDPKHSSLWSPRKGFLDRLTQAGFTTIEFAISGIYVWSLFGLLKTKSSVLQRRVMLDLICVTVIGILLDLVVIALVYTNQLGLSHPMQSFSYALKLKLEFVVLNQLMAVAVQGLRKQSFAERRYRKPSIELIPLKYDGQSDQMLLTRLQTPALAACSCGRDHWIPTGQSPSPLSPYNVNSVEPIRCIGQSPREGQEFRLTTNTNEIDTNTRVIMAGNQPGKTAESKDHLTLDDAYPMTATSRSVPYPFRGNTRDDSSNTSILAAKLKQDGLWGSKSKHNDDDEEENAIGVHMWENRGRHIIKAPWFRDKDNH